MAIFKCKMCGGDLEIIEGQSVCECTYCGTQQTLPKLDSEKKANLYDRANHFRRNNDFDKAMGIYEQILNEDKTDAEAYWSLVLCRYGIEYVEDPVTHKRIPTIKRAQYTSIFADENYKAALEYASLEQKNVYEQEAKMIDEIQKGILAISDKEEPFDVFICYKESDDNGRRTPDSVLANELYHQLTQERFKVFFSRITLEDKLGQEYEPYIFAALNSAKVMVVLGTKPEYFKAVWVKNEWARFLALIRSGAKKMLIPAYKDMDPYDLPEEFSHLQAQDMSKLGFMQDLIRGIKKIVGEEHQTGAHETIVERNSSTGNSNALIKRGNMALEDQEWEKADAFFEEVLNQDAECAEAYLGKLMAKCQRSNIASLTQYYISKYDSSETEELEACPEDSEHIEEMVSKYRVKDYLLEDEIRRQYVFERTYISSLSFRKNQKRQVEAELSSEKLLARAQQYALGDMKLHIDKMLEDVADKLNKRIADAEKSDSNLIAKLKIVYENYMKEADVKVQELYTKATERREANYKTRVSMMNVAQTEVEYKKIKEALMAMHGYKDTTELAKKCQEAINSIKENERIEEERVKNVQEERARKKRKKFCIIIVVVIISIIATITATFVIRKKIIIPNNVYNHAVWLMNNEKTIEAYKAFVDLGDFKDCREIVEQMENSNPYIIYALAQTGEIIEFGNYNGNTEWIILDKKGEKLFILSRYAVETKQYNTENTTVTWEKCTLRSWLNDTYLIEAFSDVEREMIVDTKISNYDNAKWGTDGGKDTIDKVFLLSIDEVNEYFSVDSERKATLSDGTLVWWWLRSPGYESSLGFNAADVDKRGVIHEFGEAVIAGHEGVRPAMWIDISEP